MVAMDMVAMAMKITAMGMAIVMPMILMGSVQTEAVTPNPTRTSCD